MFLPWYTINRFHKNLPMDFLLESLYERVEFILLIYKLS